MSGEKRVQEVADQYKWTGVASRISEPADDRTAARPDEIEDSADTKLFSLRACLGWKDLLFLPHTQVKGKLGVAGSRRQTSCPS